LDGVFATNGAVLEQSQILTSNNLAQLVQALELRDQVALLSGELAERCLNWISLAYARPQPTWHAHLINVKNIAYALRQALFFCSMTDPEHASGAIEQWASAIEGDHRLLGWSVGPHWLAPPGRSRQDSR
jgi:hypothetical protein